MFPPGSGLGLHQRSAILLEHGARQQAEEIPSVPDRKHLLGKRLRRVNACDEAPAAARSGKR
jgi:hypothetical protein